MAASSEDKDYVHLVTGALAQHTGSRPRIMVRNIADFERNYATYDVDLKMKDAFAFDPDLVILAIGKNVPALETEDAKARFKAGVMSILRCVLARRRPMVVVRSCFWVNAAKDEVLSQACKEAGGIFVNAGSLGQNAAKAVETNYYVSNAEAETPWQTMAMVSGTRSYVEEYLEDRKMYLGMANYELRPWAECSPGGARVDQPYHGRMDPQWRASWSCPQTLKSGESPPGWRRLEYTRQASRPADSRREPC